MFLILQRYCTLQTLGDRAQSVFRYESLKLDRAQSVFRYESLKLKSMRRYIISIDSFSVMKMGSTCQPIGHSSGAVIVSLNDKDG